MGDILLSMWIVAAGIMRSMLLYVRLGECNPSYPHEKTRSGCAGFGFKGHGYVSMFLGGSGVVRLVALVSGIAM